MTFCSKKQQQQQEQGNRNRSRNRKSNPAARRISNAAYQSLEQLESRTLFSVPVNGGVPQLSSNPSANVKIYLDFDGNPAFFWNGGYSGWQFNVPTTPAYDVDNDPTTFSDTELSNIREIWSRVSEKFSPFNVDVTTVNPGSFNDKQALQVVIGGNGSWFPDYVGGAAQQGSFTNSTQQNIAFDFTTNQFTGNPRFSNAGAADMAVLQAGHALGLNFQSAFDSAGNFVNLYNPGNSQIAPLMGSTLFSTRSLWWVGKQNTLAIQDDMAFLGGGTDGFGFRTDDAGNSISTAAALSGSGTLTHAGIIEQSNDSDYFSFTTTGGSVTIAGTVPQFGAMLNMKLAVFNSSGQQVASADNSTTSETITATLAAGNYYVSVAGHGTIACYDSSNVYQGAGDDVGQYTLTVSGPVSGSGGGGGTITTPTAPSGLTASTASSSQINLNWTDNSTNETNFVLDEATDSGFTQTLSSFTLGSNATSYSATGLVSGTTYYFRVHATNSAGSSTNSNTASATTQTVVTIPAAPSSLSATTVSSSQINLSWFDNSSNETNFVVDRATDSLFSQNLSSATLGSNVSSYSATGLNSGTTYYFRVRATNSAGSSSNSNTASATTQTVVTIPAAPSGLTAATAGSSQINLSWFDNSNNETNFIVDRATDSGFTQNFSSATLGANVTSYGETGLNSGTTYYFRVRASDSAGASSNSNTASSTTQSVVTVPAAPSNLTATIVSSSQINLSWFDNSNNETGFTIDRATDSGFTQNLTSFNTGAGTTSFAATGLNSGTAYYFRVRATDSAGSSANSNTASAITPNVLTLPAAPSNLSVSGSVASVLLSWTDSANNATGYVVQRSTDGGATFFTLATLGAGATTYSDGSFAAGVTYTYRVYAYNSVGNSAATNTVSCIPVPISPAGLSASAANSSQINLAWFDVAGETGYRVDRSTDGVNWTTAANLPSGTVNYTDSPLAPSTTYWYRVYATGLAGNSFASNFASATTSPSITSLIPAAPSNVNYSYNIARKQYMITWNDNSNNEAGFIFQYSTDGVNWTTLTTLSPDSTSCNFTVRRSTYYFRVAAFNSAGQSAWAVA